MAFGSPPGLAKVTRYVDDSGDLLKIVLTPIGGPYTITATNPANG